jgi:hypothetical protein
MRRFPGGSEISGWMTGVQVLAGANDGIFLLLATPSRPALGPTQPPIQLIPGALTSGMKGSGRKADHSPACGPEV